MPAGALVATPGCKLSGFALSAGGPRRRDYQRCFAAFFGTSSPEKTQIYEPLLFDELVFDGVPAGGRKNGGYADHASC